MEASPQKRIVRSAGHRKHRFAACSGWDSIQRSLSTANTAFARPDFIKLDVQGYELGVLRGAELALASAETVLMEVNFLGILDGAPLFHEATQFMSERGFQVYDICTFFRRPYDGALWQVDVIFSS